MKKIRQVEILHWVKTKHGLNPKHIQKSLREEDFLALCSILHKNKQIGDVISVKEVVGEFIAEHGIEYLPQSFNGEGVDLVPLMNTHAECDGFIEVSLYHILLFQWCRPTRENMRIVKKLLKELGHVIVERIPVYTRNFEKVPFLKVKPSYSLSLPLNLKRYAKPIKWYKKISNWIYLDQPNFMLEGEVYKVENIGDRWEAYFNQRFIDLFNMSEMPYLHQHPQVRGCYENAPPILALCDLTLRDVFKKTPLRKWVDTLLKHTQIETYNDCEMSSHLLNAVCDEVEGKLSKTTLDGKKIEDFNSVQGWTSIIVICYVNEVLRDYQSLL